jgi:hypothetical protein
VSRGRIAITSGLVWGPETKVIVTDAEGNEADITTMVSKVEIQGSVGDVVVPVLTLLPETIEFNAEALLVFQQQVEEAEALNQVVPRFQAGGSP